MRRVPHRLRVAIAATFAGALLFAGCSSSSGPAASTTTTRTSSTVEDAVELVATGPERTLPDAFFGFNAASIVQPASVDALLDPTLAPQLADFPVRLLRIPTGTAAQWTDWRTGRFIDDPRSPFATISEDRRPITMQDWAALVKATGATPVWDLNVLTATLDDQLEMLETAQELGLPVRYVELGNELWDPRAAYPERFPTGTAYAETMNTWIPAIRARFADVKIGVSGADLGFDRFVRGFGERYRTWNDQVLATIEGADALVIHPYWTLPDDAVPGSDVAATLAAGIDAWDDVRSTTLSAIPDDMDVWLTEWNQAGFGQTSGTQIWAQTLSVVMVAMRHVGDPRVTMSLVHNIVDGAVNPHDVGISTTFPSFTNGADGLPRLARTGLGVALPLVFGAVTPGATVQLLGRDNTDDPTRVGPVGLLVTGPEPGAVIVNPTDEPVTLALTGVLDGHVTVTSVHTAADATPGWVATDVVDTTESEAQGTVTLAPWSVTRLVG